MTRRWLTRIVVIIVALALTLALAAWSVGRFAGMTAAGRAGWTAVAEVMSALAALCTVALAALSAQSSAVSARESRLASEAASVTLGALRDTTQLLAVIFPAEPSEGGPIPLEVTFKAPFDVVDLDIRYVADVDKGDGQRDRLAMLVAGQEQRFRLLDLPDPGHHGRLGEVTVAFVDPVFGTRRVGAIEVYADGRGGLAQRWVTNWIIEQAERAR